MASGLRKNVANPGAGHIEELLERGGRFLGAVLAEVAKPAEDQVKYPFEVNVVKLRDGIAESIASAVVSVDFEDSDLSVGLKLREGFSPEIMDVQEALVDAANVIIGLRFLDLADHHELTGVYAGEMAELLGWSRERVRYVFVAAALHDIGKIYYDARMLDFEVLYTDEEKIDMRRHVELGVDFLRSFDIFPEVVLRAILEHHENHGGGGFPRGLVGEEISEEGDLVHTADHFEAATAEARGYKRRLTFEEAIQDLLAKTVPFSFPGEDCERPAFYRRERVLLLRKVLKNLLF